MSRKLQSVSLLQERNKKSMKRTLFILLTLAMLAIGGSAYAQNSFTGKVTYSYTADKVPSRIYILMVPKDKATGYTEDDVYGAFGTVYNTRGEKNGGASSKGRNSHRGLYSSCYA